MHNAAFVLRLAHDVLERVACLFRRDAFRGLDTCGGLIRVQPARCLVDVPPHTAVRVRELHTATQEDLGALEGPGDHHECGPSRVGATPDRPDSRRHYMPMEWYPEST